MPKSRLRRKVAFTPPQTKAVAKLSSRAWVVPVMLSCFILGLVWIVVWYIAGTDLPGMRTLGNWNLLVGFVFFGVGFGVSTQWR